MNTSRTLLVTVALLAAPLWADSEALQGPVLGYVLDASAQAVRPLYGIPGASHLGSPLPLPFPVAALAVSSRADFALAVSGGELPGLYLVRSLHGTPEVAAVPGAVALDTRVALNADDSAAALYSAERRTVSLLRLAAEGPAAGAAIELPGAPAAVALSRDASWALVAAGDGLYRVAFDEGAAPRLLARFEEPSGVSLLAGEREAALVDRRSHQLFVLRNVSADPEILAVAGARDGLLNPVAVASSADGRRLLVANAGDGSQPGSVAIVDPDTRAVEIRSALESAPAQLVRLRAPATFLLNDAGAGPGLLLEDAPDRAGLYFVPAVREQ